MANVHTVNVENTPDSKRAELRHNVEEFDAIFQNPADKPPSEESFLEMLRFNIFPQFRFRSFTFAIMVVFVAVFTAQLATGGINAGGALLEANFAGVTAAATVSHEDIAQRLAFHRLLLAPLVHRNFEDLIGTLTTFLVWVSWVERLFKPLCSAVIFAVGSVVGFACLVGAFREGSALGSTIGVFALMGASIGFMLYHWKRLNAFHVFCMLQVVLVLFPVVTTYLTTGKARDFVHALMGLLLGLLLGAGLAPALGRESALQRRVKFAALGAVAAVFVAALLVNFLL